MSRLDWVNLLYIVGFALFIVGLRMVRGPRTAVRGNLIAAVGMVIALVATLIDPRIGDWVLIVVGVAIGTAIGVPAARSVKMTAMPQMVALFNGVGGGAVALISLVEYREGHDIPLESLIPIVLAAIIGSISFWGSNVAFSKLQELAWAKRRFPARELTHDQHRARRDRRRARGDHHRRRRRARSSSGCCCSPPALLGITAVLPIGGADMPVVISTLNAFTGLSAAAAGIALDNTALIVAGMLVGASGSILTKQMADAMNRSIGNVFFGGFGATAGAIARERRRRRPHGALHERRRRGDPALLRAARRRRARLRHGGRPGPARGRRPRRRARAARRRGPLRDPPGRRPHARAHERAARRGRRRRTTSSEMDDINGEFARTDVALIIGANDVTNPAARNVPDSPIYGMPILDVDKASSVVVLKRSMASGFAGIDNPLFYDEKTAMLFGDAKASVSDITAEVQAL